MGSGILVVDDEKDLAATYERLLRRQGYRVVSVGSRAAGLVVLEADPPNLLIADLRLPDGDGLDVVRAARGVTPPPVVIVVTAYGSRAARAAAMEAGATAFLQKPFTAAALSALVREALGDGSR
jgi:DNA-binding response OmpR family regulator